MIQREIGLALSFSEWQNLLTQTWGNVSQTDKQTVCEAVQLQTGWDMEDLFIIMKFVHRNKRSYRQPEQAKKIKQRSKEQYQQSQSKIKNQKSKIIPPISLFFLYINMYIYMYIY